MGAYFLAVTYCVRIMFRYKLFRREQQEIRWNFNSGTWNGEVFRVHHLVISGLHIIMFLLSSTSNEIASRRFGPDYDHDGGNHTPITPLRWNTR